MKESYIIKRYNEDSKVCIVQEKTTSATNMWTLKGTENLPSLNASLE